MSTSGCRDLIRRYTGKFLCSIRDFPFYQKPQYITGNPCKTQVVPSSVCAQETAAGPVCVIAECIGEWRYIIIRVVYQQRLYIVQTPAELSEVKIFQRLAHDDLYLPDKIVINTRPQSDSIAVGFKKTGGMTERGHDNSSFRAHFGRQAAEGPHRTGTSE